MAALLSIIKQVCQAAGTSAHALATADNKGFVCMKIFHMKNFNKESAVTGGMDQLRKTMHRGKDAAIGDASICADAFCQNDDAIDIP